MTRLALISFRIPAIIVVVALLSIAATAGISLFLLSDSYRTQSHDSLKELGQLRVSAIQDYLGSIKRDLVVLSHTDGTKAALKAFSAGYAEMPNSKDALQKLYITDNPNATGEKEKLDAASDGSAYSKTHAHFHPLFWEFLKTGGYYDIFLFNPAGDLVYTVFKELDYATNMNTGQWKDTDLARALGMSRPMLK